VAEKLESLVIEQVLDVLVSTGEEIVDADDLRPLPDQALAQVRA
jgi:hypothetical protein